MGRTASTFDEGAVQRPRRAIHECKNTLDLSSNRTENEDCGVSPRVLVLTHDHAGSTVTVDHECQLGMGHHGPRGDGVDLSPIGVPDVMERLHGTRQKEPVLHRC